MKPNTQLTFGPFSLDEANECLWRDSKAISLRPKAYAVLKYLTDRAGTLVTKDELLKGVWADTFVNEAVLKDCIRQLREVFQDDAKVPQFIETVHRRGYRFIARIVEQPTKRTSAPFVKPYSPHETASAQTEVLDREEALSQLSTFLDRVINGDKQLVFVTGETGIGKTTLVEAFLKRVTQLQNIGIAKGQCLEQYGAGEAYLPVLDSFSRLGSAPQGERLIEQLRANAPNWLAQMPRLFLREGERFPENLAGLTREHMLREMAELIEAITADTPLVLVLEDLHWSDYSTLDLISYLARRQDNSRLLIIGTYRPVEVVLSEHPLKDVKRELQVHKLCHELPLEYLSREAVAEFLRLKFSANRFPDRLASLIHERTEGNPLFMINVVEYLLDEQTLVERDGTWQVQVDLDDIALGVPENIRNLIEKHVERLTADEQRVLEGASVVGMDCSAVAIAAGLAEDVLVIEQICDRLARRDYFLLPAYLATLPDGTITPRYRFIHALYLDVLYHRVASTRRSQIHGRIGRCGEALYGEQVGEIAAELAVHFEQARDTSRAVRYLRLAAENAARRSANHEAFNLARRGLHLLETLPQTSEHEEYRAALVERLSAKNSNR